MAQVSWSRIALRQSRSIVDYVATYAVTSALSLSEDFERAADRLALYPHLGRMVPEFQQPAIREVIVGQYRLVYRLDGEMVVILTVIHGSRDLLRQMPGGPWDIE